MVFRRQTPLCDVIVISLVAACGSDESRLQPIDASNGSVDATSATGGSGGSSPSDAGSGGAETSPGGRGGAAGASGANDGAAGASGCPSFAGLAMVPLPAGYCIDSTEVTRGQYAAWLATNPSLTGQPAGCESNVTFEPDPTCVQDPRLYQGPNSDRHPQTCVSWCDAYMYCLGAGKRLCSRIGGGAHENYEWNDAAKSQWYAACSSGGVTKYPYGDTYDSMACNGHDSGNQTTVEVGSMPRCQSQVSGYQGVFDLSGNAWEWEVGCGQPYCQCSVRGGGFAGSGPDRMACDDYPLGEPPCTGTAYPVGFRCCWP